jgi:hypothetical protein
VAQCAQGPTDRGADVAVAIDDREFHEVNYCPGRQFHAGLERSCFQSVLSLDELTSGGILPPAIW